MPIPPAQQGGWEVVSISPNANGTYTVRAKRGVKPNIQVLVREKLTARDVEAFDADAAWRGTPRCTTDVAQRLLKSVLSS